MSSLDGDSPTLLPPSSVPVCSLAFAMYVVASEEELPKSEFVAPLPPSPLPPTITTTTTTTSPITSTTTRTVGSPDRWVATHHPQLNYIPDLPYPTCLTLPPTLGWARAWVCGQQVHSPGSSQLVSQLRVDVYTHRHSHRRTIQKGRTRCQ